MHIQKDILFYLIIQSYRKTFLIATKHAINYYSSGNLCPGIAELYCFSTKIVLSLNQNSLQERFLFPMCICFRLRNISRISNFYIVPSHTHQNKEVYKMETRCEKNIFAN